MQKGAAPQGEQHQDQAGIGVGGKCRMPLWQQSHLGLT